MDGLRRKDAGCAVCVDVVRLRVVLASLVLSPLATGCFLFDRENPRLTSITRTQGDIQETVTIEYDDEGFPTEVVMKEALATQTLTLSWTDGVLASVAVSEDPVDAAFPASSSVVTLTWDDAGRVEKTREITKDTEPDDGQEPPVTTGGVSYDETGRFERLFSSTATDSASVDDETEFSWTDGGALEKLTSSRAVLVDGEVTASSATTFDIEARDGRPESLTVKDDDFTMVLAVKLDDKDRIDAFEGSRTYEARPDVEDIVVVGFSYDEAGRLASVTASDDDGLTDDPITELAYEDGEARGLDMTPYSIFFFGLWDLHGVGHLDFNAQTQSARFVLPTW